MAVTSAWTAIHTGPLLLPCRQLTSGLRNPPHTGPGSTVDLRFLGASVSRTQSSQAIRGLQTLSGPPVFVTERGQSEGSGGAGAVPGGCGQPGSPLGTLWVLVTAASPQIRHRKLSLSSGAPESGRRALGAGGLSLGHAMTCTVTRAAVSPHSGQRRGLASAGFLADVLPVCPHLRGTGPRERVHGRSLHPVLRGSPHPVFLGSHRTPSSWGVTAPHLPGGSSHPILLGSHHTLSACCWKEVEAVVSGQSRLSAGWRLPDFGAAPCPRARDCDLSGKGSLQMRLSEGSRDERWSWGPDCRLLSL